MIIAIALTAVLAGFSILVFYKLCKSTKRRPATLRFVGEVAVTIDEIGPDEEGFVRFHGEHWRARSHIIVYPGQKVRIVAREGLTLVAEPINEH